jgi:hypothetical protein
MNGITWLDDYQSAVLDALRDIPWAVTVGAYPDIGSEFPTPAVFLDVARWELSDNNLGGNVTLQLTCNIYILRHFMAGVGEGRKEGDIDALKGSTETRVRNAALLMSNWIHGKQFGPVSAPAVIQSAEPMVWEKSDGTQDHVIWSVSYTQDVAVGPDPFEEPDAPKMKALWLGIFPDIGPDHIDDYIPLVKREEGT